MIQRIHTQAHSKKIRLKGIGKDSLRNRNNVPLPDVEISFSSKMQESVKLLIDKSWAQYENILIKIPEQYVSKIKNYLWLSTIIVGTKFKLIFDHFESYKSLPLGCEKGALLLLFVASTMCEIVCFATSVWALNKPYNMVLSLGFPRDITERNYKHSSHLLYDMLSNIQSGIEAGKKRIVLMSNYLGTIGRALFIDILLLSLLALVVWRRINLGG